MRNYNLKLPVIVQFNLLKHHLNYIKERINYSIEDETESFITLKNELLKVGNSQMDIYTGNLSPSSICREILNELHRLEINGIVLYKDWIFSNPQAYQTLLLSDKSKWVLRIGEDEQKYVHIHPARNSFLCIRVKATTLKTAIFASVFSRIKHQVPDNLSIINSVRKEFLKEPPVKSISTARNLIKLIKLINDKPVYLDLT